MLQTKQYTELKMEVGKTFEELQKTLLFIMRKMINTSCVESGGFSTPSNCRDAVQVSRANVLPTRRTPDTVLSTTPVLSDTPFPSCNSAAAIASSPNPIVANPVTSAVSSVNASMSPVTPTFSEDTGSSLDSTLELSFDPSYESNMDQSIATTPTSETNAPVSIATIEEVRTSETENEGILRAELVRKLRRKSCSRRNFSAKLNEVLFDKDTRKRSNVAGKMGKLRLNPILMDYIKSLAFQHFPLEKDENQNSEWARCIIAIDEENRRLNKNSRNPNTLDLL